jgi:hypothetical protein
MFACYGCATPDKPVENLWKTLVTIKLQFYTAATVAREESLIWARYNHRNVKNCVNNDRSVGRTESGGVPLNVDSL